MELIVYVCTGISWCVGENMVNIVCTNIQRCICAWISDGEYVYGHPMLLCIDVYTCVCVLRYLLVYVP